MLKTSFTLIHKRSLTHDVFELIYTCPDLIKEPPQPGQYVMFQLASGLNRSYSLSDFDIESAVPTFTLIIKKIPDGKGSPQICDAEIGTTLQGIIPLGHFTLHDTENNKCFIGTGTGFAPLYCQLSHLSHSDIRVAFIFGVRHFRDYFYHEELSWYLGTFAWTEYIQYFSQESEFSQFIAPENARTGYVTEWITEENIALYQEFYLCGSPAMVKSAREQLATLGVTKEQIFWEQF